VSKSTVWVSYDLGVRGDYESLYAWLDDHRAKECGDSLAVLSYEHSGALLDSMKADIKDSVEINKRTRIYVIYKDAKSKNVKGAFLFGGRRVPPWTGFSGRGERQVEDEA
jgi:hypothetical protein